MKLQDSFFFFPSLLFKTRLWCFQPGEPAFPGPALGSRGDGRSWLLRQALLPAGARRLGTGGQEGPTLFPPESPPRTPVSSPPPTSPQPENRMLTAPANFPFGDEAVTSKREPATKETRRKAEGSQR